MGVRPLAEYSTVSDAVPMEGRPSHFDDDKSLHLQLEVNPRGKTARTSFGSGALSGRVRSQCRLDLATVHSN